MRKTPYTPGPWVAVRNDNAFAPVSQIFSKEKNLIVAGDVPLSADARLVAAAPELLAACELAYANLSPLYPSHHLVMTELFAAITRAGGDA